MVAAVRVHKLGGPEVLTYEEIDIPAPGPGQVRLHVRTCGVCRTDLHLAEGDLDPTRPQVVPGHEVVGEVDQRGPGSERFSLGQRVGVPWLAHTCGVCRFCTAGRENLCVAPLFTGWDLDGGYAEYVLVEEAYACLLYTSMCIRDRSGPA